MKDERSEILQVFIINNANFDKCSLKRFVFFFCFCFNRKVQENKNDEK